MMLQEKHQEKMLWIIEQIYIFFCKKLNVLNINWQQINMFQITHSKQYGRSWMKGQFKKMMLIILI